MNSTKNLIWITLGTALIWVGAFASIPLGPMPITLQTMMVVVVGMLLGVKRGPLAVLLYSFLGIIGLPVFAGFKSGVAAFTASPTAGFLVGFLPAVLLVGIFFYLPRGRRGFSLYLCTAIAAVVGMVVPYFFGIPWFMHYTGKTLSESLPLVLIPFILGDTIKTVAAYLVGVTLLKAHNKSEETSNE